jgi:hypothetical protein
MKIRIPRWFISAWDIFGDWVNVPVGTVKFRSKRYNVLRIDIIIAAAFLFCVGWYYATSGWYMALVGGVAFVFFAMCALWLF